MQFVYRLSIHEIVMENVEGLGSARASAEGPGSSALVVEEILTSFDRKQEKISKLWCI